MLKTRLCPRLVSLIILTFLFNLTIGHTCLAAKEKGLSEQYLSEFAQNDILFYNPGECISKGTVKVNTESCFKIDDSTNATDYWYGEGCLNTGACKSDSVKYYAQGQKAKSDNGLVMTKNNEWIYEDTKVDDDFGGMQYIYAENYDYKYDGSGTILTPNKGNSKTKYYWIVLPDQAYTNGFGDLYVATFEKLDDPVYFIVFDAHACAHQSEKYCDQAEKDPEKVAIGKQFFGTFTKDGSKSGGVDEKTGKLTSFCRLDGSGEVTAKGNSGTATPAKDKSDKSGSDSNKSGKSDNAVNSKALELAWPYGQTVKAQAGPTDAYKKAIEKYTLTDMDNGGEAWQDPSRRMGMSCDLFVATVMRASGVDENYPIGLPGQYPYVKDNENYQEVSSYEDAQAGDIAFYSDNGSPFDENRIGGGNGHTWLIVNDDGKRRSAQASWGEETGVVKDIQFTEKDVKVFRPKNGGGGSNSCTSFSGKYPQYYQDNYEGSDHENSNHNWTTDVYNGGNIADSGCGPTSAAMLVTVATGKDVYPQDIVEATSEGDPHTYNYVSCADSACSDGGLQLDKKLEKKYGLEVIIDTYSSKSDAYDKMKKYLNDGYMIHLSGDGNHAGFSNTNTSGHYVGIFSIDENDNIWVANSFNISNSQVKLQDIVDAAHNGAFSAIKGPKNTKNTCSDEGYCPNGANGGKASKSGATLKQAEIIAHWYNTKHIPKGCCGLMNCVEFSNFFVAELTTKGTPGGYVVKGDGNMVAPNLIADGVAEGGNEPRAWSVFSDSGQHTGVVIGANSDGTFITIEAAWGGWQDGYVDGAGNARVYPAKTFDSTYTFAYFEDHLNEAKINEILNE